MRELDWLRAHVSARLSAEVRRLDDTDDVVQEAMLKILRHGPHFVTSHRDRFRALLARVVQNVLTDRFRYSSAEKRSVARTAPFEEMEVLDLDLPSREVRGPGSEVEHRERRGWVRLALELLDREDREVLVLRQIESRSFQEVGALLSISEDAARMRFNRALPRLAQKVMGLQSGQLDRILDEDGS
jgi:RNA polymerase sigma-70 factor (ECF subfamily)